MSVFPPPQLQYKLALIKLQKQRSKKITLWRTCLLISFTMSLGVSISLPYWQIQSQKQIKVEGDNLVSEATIFQSLGLDYPQLIWAVSGIQLKQRIESIPSVKVAQVNRQIMPPALHISLQEKVPVAVATSQGEIGFLDNQGAWIATRFYNNVGGDKAPPELKVIDYKNHLKPVWQKLFKLIELYPELKISEVHWNQSNSLYLQTKIGQVLLGAESSHLEKQFELMSKLKNLPKQLNRSEIAYIDLSNPNVNLIQKY